MKTAAAWSTLLWFAVVCEQMRPDLLPPGSLVIAIATGCLFATRTATGIVVAGLALVLNWIISSAGPPLEVATVLLLSARLNTITRNRGSTRRHHSHWSHPVIVTVAGVLVLSAVLSVDSISRDFLPALTARLIVAVPCACVITLVSHLFAEFGFRSTASI